jgi:hypothetical protein
MDFAEPSLGSRAESGVVACVFKQNDFILKR